MPMDQRDPTLFAFMAISGCVSFVWGVLVVLGNVDRPWMLAVGLVLTIAGSLLAGRSYRQWRHERARPH